MKLYFLFNCHLLIILDESSIPNISRLRIFISKPKIKEYAELTRNLIHPSLLPITE